MGRHEICWVDCKGQLPQDLPGRLVGSPFASALVLQVARLLRPLFMSICWYRERGGEGGGS